MGLFDVVPSNFFTVLVSGNREVYADALRLLHQMFQYELNIRVDDYIASLISMLEDKAFVPEEDDEVTAGGLTLSGKARLILNRFVKTGWIDKEFLDGSFVEIITPINYAISAMKLLSELSQNTLREYNSLVFSTYSGLKQAKSEHESHMYEAILSARTNTERLEYELRTLYHGDRGIHIEFQRDGKVIAQRGCLIKKIEPYSAMETGVRMRSSDKIYISTNALLFAPPDAFETILEGLS